MADDIKYAPCILCARVNAHKVLARQDRGSEEGSDIYYFLACAGCGAVSMANIYKDGDDEARYYPSAISRKPPDWLWKRRFLFVTAKRRSASSYMRFYEAVQGKQHRLALMGIANHRSPPKTMIVVPSQSIGIRALPDIQGWLDLVTVKRVIVFAVLKLLPDAPTDLEP